jgi:hypothetical protein
MHEDAELLTFSSAFYIIGVIDISDIFLYFEGCLDGCNDGCLDG